MKFVYVYLLHIKLQYLPYLLLVELNVQEQERLPGELKRGGCCLPPKNIRGCVQTRYCRAPSPKKLQHFASSFT